MTFEEREKWLCGNCATVDYRAVGSVLEDEERVTIPSSTEVESEKEEASTEVESEKEDVLTEVESEKEDVSTEVESEKEDVSTEVESETKNKEDSIKTKESSSKSKDNNQVASLQSLFYALIEKKRAFNNDVYIASLDSSEGFARKKTFKK